MMIIIITTIIIIDDYYHHYYYHLIFSWIICKKLRPNLDPSSIRVTNVVRVKQKNKMRQGVGYGLSVLKYDPSDCDVTDGWTKHFIQDTRRRSTCRYARNESN